ncbi:MAG: hypothetical protein ACRBN8_23690 [Nannocystales bacterium]
MPDRFSVELAQGVIIARYDGRPDEAEFDAYLERYTDLVKRGVPYATVYTTGPDARMPTPRQVRLQAKWMKDHRDLAGSLNRGLAFHLPTPLMRGVLRGLLAIQPLGGEHVIVPTEAEAVAWALARLKANP